MREPLSQIFQPAIIWRLRALLSPNNKAAIARRTPHRGKPRPHDEESVYDSVQEIAGRENIESAAVLAVGGIRSGKVVTGPKEVTGKVIPHIEEFDDARKLVGFGAIFPHDGKPLLHFHAGIGRENGALVGCPREGMSVYLVLDVIIIELIGARAERALDPEFGVHLLKILGQWA